MCDTCPAHIPGPGEVAGGALGLAVGAAMTKPGRRVMFWGFCVPLLPFAVVGVFGWWTIALVAGAAIATAAAFAWMRVLHGRVVMPAATPAQRQAELERRRRNAIPVPRPALPRARPALPRAVVRSLTGRRQALPAAQGPTVVGTPVVTYNKTAGKLEVVTGKVVPAPVHGKVVR
jgi:hypothetical protein